MSGITYIVPERPSSRKAPGARLIYGFDWTAWLTQESRAIASASIAGTGVTVENVAHAGGVVTCVVSGGTLGQEAVLTCSIVTDGVPAQEEQRSIWLRIEQT